MPKPQTPWDNPVENADLARFPDLTASRLATYLNEKHHRGLTVRTKDSVTNRRKFTSTRTEAPIKQQEVERTESEGRIVLKSNGSRITTIDELLAHAQVDTTQWQIASQRVKAWDSSMRGEDGPQTVQNFALHVEVEPKAGPNVLEAVEAIIAGAFADRKPMAAKKHTVKGELMQALVIADPHVAKHAWNAETGYGDYDIKIATDTLRAANAHLIQRGNTEKLAARHIYLLGDYFHYDTPNGTTTKGTVLERDGRVQKMIVEGAKAICDIIEWSAETVPTHVVIVGGNHDEVLSHALQVILTSHFRLDQRVTIDQSHTPRKYVTWGKCLLGLTHGDKAKKVLPSLMAREASAFSTARLREWHRGHLHYRKDTDSLEGVLIRQHPALCPPDSWHAGEGFVSDRGQDSIIYHAAGYATAVYSYAPDL